MAVNMSGSTLTEIKLQLCHDPSGTQIVSAAPTDNGGDGSSFSPTDLCAVSLAACAITVMGLRAKKIGYAFAARFELAKEMNPAPRRIASITIHYRLTAACAKEEFEALIKTAKTCPVRLSLHPDVAIHETFENTHS